MYHFLVDPWESRPRGVAGSLRRLRGEEGSEQEKKKKKEEEEEEEESELHNYGHMTTRA